MGHRAAPLGWVGRLLRQSIDRRREVDVLAQRRAGAERRVARRPVEVIPERLLVVVALDVRLVLRVARAELAARTRAPPELGAMVRIERDLVGALHEVVERD